MAMRLDTAYQHVFRVSRFVYLGGKCSRGRRVKGSRPWHLQCFMRTHLIDFLAKAIKSQLLLAPMGSRRLCRLLLKGGMLRFVPSVLLMVLSIERHCPH